MQTFTANLFQLAILGVGISLLTLWARYLKETRHSLTSRDEESRLTDRGRNPSAED